MKTRAVEYLLAMLQLAWGLAVLTPFVKLDGANYRTLIALAPEVVWGNFAVAIGACRLAALIINGRWRRTPLLRAIGAAIGLVWWIVLGGLFVIAVNDGAPAFPFMFGYPVFILFEFFSMYRCGIDMHEMGALTRARPGVSAQNGRK
jgi:hypothetical protein